MFSQSLGKSPLKAPVGQSSSRKVNQSEMEGDQPRIEFQRKIVIASL